jgi:ABC-type lipoprotein export system ATPase subunit
MMLRLKNITKTFHQAGETIRLFSNLNLEIPSGTARVLMGASGCGKTTLLRMINGLQKPDSGDVLFDEISLYGQNEKDIRTLRCKTIGFADQQAIMLPQLTALENVLLPTLGLQGDWITQAKNLLVEMGLEQRADFFPHQLSGGERQRVAWARALIRKPQLLLLDEPTSSLDPSRSQELLSLLQTLNRDKQLTVIIATHHTQTLDYFPDVIRLDEENSK